MKVIREVKVWAWGTLQVESDTTQYASMVRFADEYGNGATFEFNNVVGMDRNELDELIGVLIEARDVIRPWNDAEVAK